jgi:hypothetical protein
MGDQHLVRLCAAGLGVAILAGCGGPSPQTTSTGGTSRTPPATSPATSRSPTPATPAQLEKIVLRAADFSTSWKGTAHQGAPSDALWRASFVRCLGVRNTYSDKASEAYSQDFAHGDAVVVSNATSYRSQRHRHRRRCDPGAEVRALCGSVDEEPVSAVTTTGTPIVASFKITPGSGGGPTNVAGTGTGTIKSSVNGQQVVYYLSFAYITGPLIEAEVDTTNGWNGYAHLEGEVAGRRGGHPRRPEVLVNLCRRGGRWMTGTVALLAGQGFSLMCRAGSADDSDPAETNRHCAWFSTGRTMT